MKSLFIKIFGGEPRIKVLDFIISEPGIPFYKNELVKKTKISRITATKILKELESQDIIKKYADVGKVVQYIMNKENFYTKLLLDFDFRLSEKYARSISKKMQLKSRS